MVVALVSSHEHRSAREVSVTRGTGRRMLAMAGGTAVSRGTGLLRVLVLAWVLGFSPLADAFNLANTIPNMLFDLVLGGVLSATFIPVFIEQLAVQGERRAWRSISSVVSVALLTLLVACVVTFVAAPWIIDGFTALQHSPKQLVTPTVVHQRVVATTFLRWFVPQVFFYGVIGIGSALLNIRHRFGVVAWAPIANNLVCIVVLCWFHLVDPSPTLTSVSQHHHLLWLGLGTSLGVAVQFLCMVPSLARNDLYRLRLRFDFADPALRAIARLGSWTLAVVVTNQVSLYVVLAFAFGIGGNGPVSAYTYGWSFMQMPYAVIVVSVLGVLTPQLAGLATANDAVGFTRRLSQGLRQSLVIIVPCAAALVVLAQPVVGVLLNHGRLSANLLAGSVVAVLAAGLPGFTVFQLCIRGLQALQRARDVFLLYALENGLTIALCFVLGRHSMTGLTGAVSLAYTLSAVVALAVLHVQRVPLVGTLASRAVRRSAVGSLAMAFVMAGAYAAVTWSTGALLLVRVGLAAVLGIVTYGLVLYIGERRDALRRNVEP